MDETEQPDERKQRDRPRYRLSEKQNGGGDGIRCPGCHGTWFKVIATRQKADKIVRRRQCRRCDRTILTTERLTG